MICDALLEADHVLKISDAVNDPEVCSNFNTIIIQWPVPFYNSAISMHLLSCQEYLRLTDCVLKTIECSRDPALGKSQAIIRRLRKRQLYKLVDTILLPKAIDAKVRKVRTRRTYHALCARKEFV